MEEMILQGADQNCIEKGKSEEVTILIFKIGLKDQQAAEIAGVSLDFVKAVREILKKIALIPAKFSSNKTTPH